MKKDYEIDENNEIDEKPNIFRLFRYFRNPSSFNYKLCYELSSMPVA